MEIRRTIPIAAPHGDRRFFHAGDRQPDLLRIQTSEGAG